MQFLEGIVIALRSLVANKLRSILTLIGVIIGVMTVIAVVAIISGMNKYVETEISSMGSTTFLIRKFGMITSSEEWFKQIKRKNLTLKDMEAIKENCPDCGKVGAEAISWRKVKYKNKHLSNMTIVGATANITEIANHDVYEGRGISEFEVEHNRQVCFVGWEIVENLFPNEDPMGKDIKIGNDYFRIIGVAKKKGTFLGDNQDNFVLIPITTYQKIFKRSMFLMVFVKARDFMSMQEAMDQCRLILRARRNVPYDKEDDFAILTSESIMDFFRQFTRLALMVMGGIASISLVVGGIVIMNIMLVSVTERTKEIGIRKALGARRRNILWQFLVEAVTLALVGGIAGVAMGALIAKILSLTTPLPSAVEGWSVAVALFVASSVGIFFGIFPAMKAARLNPIEALRYE
ncbi:MAG: ABC transporter permease [candidate division Zixibacteria bacterium]|nr:ABC transporter permease [candidate division Zixibacteria bacterium]